MIHFQYKAKEKNKYPRFIVFSLIVLIFLFSYGFSGTDIMPLWLLQTFLILFTGGIVLVLLKYIVTDYLYELRDNNLNIYKIQGKKSTEVGSLNLSSLDIPVMTKKEYKEREKELCVKSVFSYRKNMYADYYVYIFDFNSKRCAIMYEPSEEFVKLQNEIIKKLKEEKDSEI